MQVDVTVKRLPDTFIPKIFLSVQQMRLSTLLAIAFTDGSVEIRDRITMELIARDNIHKQIAVLHVAYSPNICALAHSRDGTDVSICLLQMPVDETVDDELLEAIAEGFVLHFSSACTSYGNHQADLLAVMQLFSDHHPDSKIDQRILNELYRVLDIRLDHAMRAQPDWLFKNSIIQRCLGSQLSLGYHGTQLPRSLPAKIAQGFLDIRSATLITMYGARKKVPDQQAPTDAERAEELRAVIGQISWFTSFMSFVVNQLFRLSPDDDDDNQNPLTQPAIQSKVHSLSTPALSLLLISTSRLFLKYNCQTLRQYAFEANSFRGYPSPLRDAYQTVISVLRDSPVQLVQFEKMITEVDTKIKEAYQSGSSSSSNGGAGITDAERKNIEKEMLVSGTIPSVLMPAVTTLLTSTVTTLREEIDVAELYFSDFSWLDLNNSEPEDSSETEKETATHNTDEPRKKKKKKRRRIEKPRVDSIRKVELKPGSKFKRCVRCCALIGDDRQQQQQQQQPYATRNQALAQLLKTCLCGDQCMDPAREK
ncbi:MAG: hypothetical protein Q9191_006872 [Dirinaria sp. TL-2023a]